MFIHEGRVLNLLVPLTLGDMQYPAGWFFDASAADRSAVGIVEVTEPVAPAAPEGKVSVLRGFAQGASGEWLPVWDIEDQPAPSAEPVPEQVAMWQARAILIEDDMLDDVNAALAAIADEKARKLAQAKFEYSSTVRRDDPLVTETIPALGKSEGEIDGMFIRAARLV